MSWVVLSAFNPSPDAPAAKQTHIPLWKMRQWQGHQCTWFCMCMFRIFLIVYNLKTLDKSVKKYIAELKGIQFYSPRPFHASYCIDTHNMTCWLTFSKGKGRWLFQHYKSSWPILLRTSKPIKFLLPFFIHMSFFWKEVYFSKNSI